MEDVCPFLIPSMSSISLAQDDLTLFTNLNPICTNSTLRQLSSVNMTEDTSDRAVERQEVKTGHQINAEIQYPSWNKHTAEQLKKTDCCK